MKTLVKSKVIAQQQNITARQSKTNILRQSRKEINENWNAGWIDGEAGTYMCCGNNSTSVAH